MPSVTAAWYSGVIGQDAAVRTLDGLLEQGGAGRFVLLVGAAGIGKGTVAQKLATALLCRSGPHAPCGRCLACRAPQDHPDAVWLTAERMEGTIKVDDVRDAATTAFYPPLEARHRVWVIDPMDELTDGAANALLRMLEEPPSRLWVIGVAHNQSAVKATLRSRALMVPLKLLDPDAIARIAGGDEPAALHSGSVQRARLLGDAGFRAQLTAWNALIDAPGHDPDGAVRFARDLKDDGGLQGFLAGVLTMWAATPYDDGDPDHDVAAWRRRVDERVVLLDTVRDLDMNVNPAFACEAAVRRLRRLRKTARR